MADFSRLAPQFSWVDAGNGGTVPLGVLALDDPYAVAALRQRATVKGGRREGKATAALDALGTGLYNAAARPSRIWNALNGLQPGEALSDHPEIADQGAALGLDLVGLPGLTGGVPFAALGSGAGRMSRNGMVENARAFKQHALDARNEGTGSTARVYDSQGAIDRAQGGSPAKDSFERAAQEARAGFDSARANAQDDFLRAAYPERYPEVVTPRTNESLADLFARHRSGDDFMTFANATDRKTGALATGAGFLKNVRPAGENLDNVAAASFTNGRLVGNRTVPLSSLNGGISTAADDAKKVADLVEKMKGPGGYIERLIVDDAGNVIEGQHRLDALRQLGAAMVPVTVIRDATRGLPVDAMAEAIRGVGKTHPDHVNQIVGQIGDMLAESGAKPAAVLQGYEFPAAFRSRFEAALNAIPGKQ